MAKNQPLPDTHREPIPDLIDFSGKAVLEIGCGSGGFTKSYLGRAYCIYCIDPDAEAINYLKAECSKIFRGWAAGFRVGNVEDFPLPEKAFDIAVFSNSF